MNVSPFDIDTGRSSREALIERHLPLARALAYRYRRGPEPLEDLVQVASVGLVKAAQRWDPDRGFAFAAFAMPTILGELRRHIRDRTWAVRPPRSLQELSLRVDRAWNALFDRDGREPTVAALAEHLRLSPGQVIEGLAAMGFRKPVSLDAPVRSCGGDAVCVGDTVGSDDNGYAGVESRDAFDRTIAKLPRRERAILRLRFEQDLLQSEIGARVGRSQVQVSRLLRNALEALAHPHVFPAAA
jgi:RNA polymerase sigma-B factor